MREEGENHLPQPPSHTSFYATHVMLGFLGCQNTLMAYTQFFNQSIVVV